MSRRWWVLFGICAVLTHRQIPRFSSDVALWQAAAVGHPTAPRPAVNLAAYHIQRGEFLAAEVWIARARRALTEPERWRERQAVGEVLDRQQVWIDAFSSSR